MKRTSELACWRHEITSTYRICGSLASSRQAFTEAKYAWRIIMIKRVATSMAVIVVCLGVFLAVPARAQSSAGPAWQQWTYQMMKDLTEEMSTMTEQMGRGELSPDQRLQMARRMERMSMMMRRMSSVTALPTMKEADQTKKMQQMRKQMDEMMRDSRMTPHG
jgi:uncharacterized membrane protein YeiB